jgi:hypothetical protein
MTANSCSVELWRGGHAVKRGIWRWWKERAGGDEWFARVENEHGEFADVEAAQYEAQDYQPSFWSLPLQEEHLENMIEPFQRGDAAERQAVHWGGWAIVVLTVLLLLWAATNLSWL